MGDGIFGQVPQNGEYIVGAAARKPLFGVGQIAPGSVYVEPPYYDDGGLLRIDPGSVSAFKWSMNATTTSDGAALTDLTGYANTSMLEVLPVTFGGAGDNWFDNYLASGFVVLFRGKPITQLSNTLTFIVTMDPAAIKEFAAADANDFMVVDGPAPLIELAKGVAPTPGAAPPQMPPPELPAPTPAEPLPAPPAPAVAPAAAALAPEGPSWLLPTLIGVAGVSIFAIMRARRKKGKG
jgi:hypothetical protein